jgi:hypothetical protein
MSTSFLINMMKAAQIVDCHEIMIGERCTWTAMWVGVNLGKAFGDPSGGMRSAYWEGDLRRLLRMDIVPGWVISTSCSTVGHGTYERNPARANICC